MFTKITTNNTHSISSLQKCYILFFKKKKQIQEDTCETKTLTTNWSKNLKYNNF